MAEDSLIGYPYSCKGLMKESTAVAGALVDLSGSVAVSTVMAMEFLGCD